MIKVKALTTMYPLKYMYELVTEENEVKEVLSEIGMEYETNDYGEEPQLCVLRDENGIYKEVWRYWGNRYLGGKWATRLFPNDN